jgi:[acyl-carrier-protein] S-malonyltransferase
MELKRESLKMPKTAILFTGQGAQVVGMGRDVAEASPAAATIYEQANAITGDDLRSLCFKGPAEALERTDVQQPAIFTTSVAIWAALAENGGIGEQPAAMAGLSLGEYTALHAAGSIAFEDALRLVKRRGELMQEAALATAGGMVSAIGLDPEQVEELCRQAAEGEVLQPANFNCPGQVVVSGAKAACQRVAELIDDAGGRAVPLPVAGAFHSPLMQSAADALAEMLEKTPISAPAVPVVANVNCQNHSDAGTIRQWLKQQLTQPVRWQASVERMIEEGVERFIEIGPGRVLTGLMRKISRRTPVVNVATAASVAELVASTA